jgi:hypothetical protein
VSGGESAHEGITRGSEDCGQAAVSGAQSGPVGHNGREVKLAGSRRAGGIRRGSENGDQCAKAEKGRSEEGGSSKGGVVSRPHQYSLTHWLSVFRIESAPEKLYSLPMDVEKVLGHLREKLARLDAAILKSKHPPSPAQKKRLGSVPRSEGKAGPRRGTR